MQLHQNITKAALVATGLLLSCTTPNTYFCEESTECLGEQACVRNTCGNAALLSLEVRPIRRFRFAWSEVPAATHYKLLVRHEGDSEFVQVGEDIATENRSVDVTVPLHLQLGAQYVLQSCSAKCTDSEPLEVQGNLTNAIGYVKQQSAFGIPATRLGQSIALSADGKTLVVGAPGIEGAVGGVFVVVNDGSSWGEPVHLLGSNPSVGNEFGYSVALSTDGNVLAVGAPGVGNTAGATVFRYENESWVEETIITASNGNGQDGFGYSVALSGDAMTLVVGAPYEDSNETGIHDGFLGGDQSDNSLPDAGAAYVFVRTAGSWTQQSYVKASSTGMHDTFGSAVVLSSDGTTLAIGAPSGESGNGAAYVFARTADSWTQEGILNTGVAAVTYFGGSLALTSDGNVLAVGAQFKNARSGTAYVFVRDGTSWNQQAALKASNTEEDHAFGRSVSITANGETLAIGAHFEGSNALGVGGEQANRDALKSGAVYVFGQNDEMSWTQRSYLKASNTNAEDWFGRSIALSADGSTLAVGAPGEDSAALGLDGNQSDNSSLEAGAVYLY